MEILNKTEPDFKYTLRETFLAGAAGALGVLSMRDYQWLGLEAVTGSLLGAAVMGVSSGMVSGVGLLYNAVKETSKEIPNGFKRNLVRTCLCIRAGIMPLAGTAILSLATLKTMYSVAPALLGGMIPVMCAMNETALASSLLALSMMTVVNCAAFSLSGRQSGEKILRTLTTLTGGAAAVACAAFAQQIQQLSLAIV